MREALFHEKIRNSKRWNQGGHKEVVLDSWNSQDLSVKNNNSSISRKEGKWIIEREIT